MWFWQGALFANPQTRISDVFGKYLALRRLRWEIWPKMPQSRNLQIRENRENGVARFATSPSSPSQAPPLHFEFLRRFQSRNGAKKAIAK